MEDTNKSIFQFDVDNYNESVGTLNQEDSINCSICKNKGKIAFLDGKYMKIKDCECMKKRILYKRFMETGVSKEQFKNYQLNTYTTDLEWQQDLMNKVKEYIYDILNNNKKNWFYIGGISGSGKTHLCTGIFSKLIQYGYDGRYMVWNSEVPELISMKQSFYTDVQDKFRAKKKELINCDILYIDDFLQADNTSKDIMSMAYDIINARYSDPNKITIISSEVLREELQKKTNAITGRIFERTDSGKYFINITGLEKNYRLRK